MAPLPIDELKCRRDDYYILCCTAVVAGVLGIRITYDKLGNWIALPLLGATILLCWIVWESIKAHLVFDRRLKQAIQDAPISHTDNADDESNVIAVNFREPRPKKPRDEGDKL